MQGAGPLTGGGERAAGQGMAAAAEAGPSQCGEMPGLPAGQGAAGAGAGVAEGRPSLGQPGGCAALLQRPARRRHFPPGGSCLLVRKVRKQVRVNWSGQHAAGIFCQV